MPVVQKVLGPNRSKCFLQGALMERELGPHESRWIIFDEFPASSGYTTVRGRVVRDPNGEVTRVWISHGDGMLSISRDTLLKKAKEGDLLCNFLADHLTRAKLAESNAQAPVTGGKIIGYKRVIPQRLRGNLMLTGNEEDMSINLGRTPET